MAFSIRNFVKRLFQKRCARSKSSYLKRRLHSTEALEDRSLLASVLSFTASSLSVSESNGTVTVTVERTEDLQGTSIVGYSTFDFTAETGKDFDLTQGSLRFDAGETTKTFTVPILDDFELEPQEAFELQLVNPINATLGNAVAAVTIVDDEAAGQTAILSPVAVLAEHQRSNEFGAAQNTINRSGFVGALDLDENPRDFYESDIWFVNPAEDNHQDVPQVLYYDLGSIQEVREVYLWEQNDGPAIGSLTNISVDYLSAGQDPGAFTLPNLAAQTWQPGIVDVGIAENVFIGQVQQFSAPVNSRYLRLTINAASTGTSGAFGFNEFAVGIPDSGTSENNSPGEVGLAHSAVSVIEFRDHAAINITRINGSTGQITIDYTTVNQSATAGIDYQPVSGTVTLEDGQTGATILVPILDDTESEEDETFSIALDSVTGGAFLGQPRTAVITILDDEAGNSSNGGFLSNYTFADSTSTDFAGASNGFLVNGAAAIVDTQRGLVAEFDGQNDRVLIPHVLEYNVSNLTLATWVRPDSFTEGVGLISRGVTNSPWALKISDDGHLLFSANRNNPTGAVGDGTFASTSAIVPSQWTHVAVTYDGTDIRFYINGILDQTHTAALTFGSSTENLWLGTDLLLSDGHFDGRLDDARIYNRALDATEIETIIGDTSGSSLGSETIVSGLNQPVAIEFAPDGRMFIAEKAGVVRIFENGQLQESPFIDISAQVNNVRDRGLMGIAVHPDFPSIPYVYLSYVYDPPETATETGLAAADAAGNRVSRITRVTADVTNNYNTIVPGSEVVLLGTNSTWANISHPELDSTVDISIDPSCDGGTLQDCVPVDSQSHGVGDLRFGLDGMLYIASGDGTSYGRVDPRTSRVQDLDSLSGKLLRIDPITGVAPSDNPFFEGDGTSNRSKVYSYGLRNPFRFAVHPVSGEPYIGDVGWATWEEINVGEGQNFGWPYYEGGTDQNFETGGYRDLQSAQDFYASGATVTQPVWSRTHAAGARAIVVGDFYVGSEYDAQFNNSLFFTDFGEPTIRALQLDGNGDVVNTETVTGSVGLVVGMTMGPDEHMYYVDILGRVGRIVDGAGTGSSSEGSADFVFDVESGTLRVQGTPGDDSFEFNMTTPDTIKINDIDYSVNVGTTRIEIDGFSGDDTVRIVGTAGDDFVQIYPTSLQYQSSGLVVTATSAESITVDAVDGGVDTAYLYDSNSDDFFSAHPTSASMSGAGYSSLARTFDRVAAFAYDGSDIAHLYDSTNDEVFNGFPSYANLTGNDFYYIALGFDVAETYSTGGTDTALFFDSAGDDLYVAKPDYAYLRNTDFYNYAQGYSTTTAFATAGGIDEAQLYDSIANDRFVADSTQAVFHDELQTWSNTAQSFESVAAYSTQGGTDIASLTDSAGDDRLVAEPQRVSLTDSAATYELVAAGFERTLTNGTNGGFDTALFYDSAGDDFFIAKPEFAYLSGTGFYNFVSGFFTAAYAENGGFDQVQFYDGATNDFFIARADVAFMREENVAWSHAAYQFEAIAAYAVAGGTDEAQFYDSDGNDNLVARPGRVDLQIDPVFGNTALASIGFERNRAFKTKAGTDQIEQFAGLDYFFEKVGDWDVVPGI